MHPTFYRTTHVDGLSLFYREAGPKDAPTLLLLHGLPSSGAADLCYVGSLHDGMNLVAKEFVSARDDVRGSAQSGPRPSCVGSRFWPKGSHSSGP